MMSDLLKGRKKAPLTPEQQDRVQEMAKLRAEIDEKKARRVRVVQDRHC